jgi:hypothetical protein
MQCIISDKSRLTMSEDKYESKQSVRFVKSAGFDLS